MSRSFRVPSKICLGLAWGTCKKNKLYITIIFEFVFTHVLLCPGKGNLPDELDEIEVYGSEAQSGTQLATYSFEVRSFSVLTTHSVHKNTRKI